MWRKMQAVVRQESGSAPKEEDDKRFSHAQKMVSKLSEEVSEQKERLKHLGNGWQEWWMHPAARLLASPLNSC
jgi:hypothetical protein